MERLRVIANHCSKERYDGVVPSNTTSTTKPCIHLSKTHALLNEKVCITVTGLKANQKVTLQTHVDEGSKSFGSCGHYVADCGGKVNTFEHECCGGTYEGLEPMGLFWSMQSIPGSRPRRIFNTDVTCPFDVVISLHLGHVRFNDLPWTVSCQPLDSCHFLQHYIDDGVKVIPVKEDGILGTLFLPEDVMRLPFVIGVRGPGPFPAVIDLFGLTPVPPGHRSSLLASNGIASFNLTPFKQMGLKTMDYNHFLKAFDWLSRHPSVDPKALGGIGSCAGAALISLIAWKRPNMRCFVSINSPVRPGGPTQEVEGEMVESHIWPWHLLKEIDGAISWRPMGQVEFNVPCLQYWRHGVKALHVLGEDDQTVNPDALRAGHEVVPKEFKSNIEFLSYPGAGHILEPPYIPLCHLTYDPIFKYMMLWGGQAKEHNQAQEDSWPRIVDFLKRNLME